ncbi:MAG: DUF5695 domain-containing protein [Balneolaceae bacterium]
MKRSIFPAALSLLLCMACATPQPEEQTQGTATLQADNQATAQSNPDALSNDRWKIEYSDTGLTQLTYPSDPHEANVLSGTLGHMDVRYRFGNGEWQDLSRDNRQINVNSGSRTVTYLDEPDDQPFRMVQTFRNNGDALEWNIDVHNLSSSPVTLGDVAIRFPWNGPGGGGPLNIFRQGFTKKHFISGDGSHMIFTKGGGEPPFLLLAVQPGTKLEYFDAGGGNPYRAYVHSGYSGNAQTEGTWRLPHTYLDLGPADSDNDSFSYGFTLHWAETYDELREVLVENDLIDVRVVPGMTVPEDLEAKFSLHTRTSIEDVVAEFPNETEINYLGESEPNHHIYSVKFNKLGENMITVRFDGGRETFLEFFSTEPVETLMHKRSDFIVNSQQHRNPDVWYDGLYSVWDMKNGVLRGPDNTDGFDGWWGYVLAADDPALGIAPMVASWNAIYPDEHQIESLEYYLERYVWGGLQRTDEEESYPYGIYGVPNWYVASDVERRREIESGSSLELTKVWRAYDYPHIFMLYYHMYQIAERYPDMVNYLDAEGYLERMIGTAEAFFEYPYEISSYYRIYEAGYYNEMLLPEMIELLEEVGRQDVADYLRREWEKKVLFHTYSHPYPYGSEYAFDRTAFESTYAFARYGAIHEIAPGDSLWYDRNRDMWHSYDETSREDVREFMDRQHYANLATRGWLEPKYFLMGSDLIRHSHTFILSYMAKMGGWSILNYGLEFSDEPHDWLQLGYNSYLSSFALMNTGTEESNYGYWFPGEVNDGAIGWAFMESKHGRAWVRKDEDRGAWRYDGEINLGIGTVTRLASTILTDDPIFGWTAYGANLERSGGAFEMVPRDGVRIRFWMVDEASHIGIQLERDGWAEGRPIRVSEDLGRAELQIENRTGTTHTNRLQLQVHDGQQWQVSLDGNVLEPVEEEDFFEFERIVYELNISDPLHNLEVTQL